MKAYIAKKYQVEWECTCIKSEEVAEFVNEINEIAEETAYEYNDGSYYEFDREGLEVVVNNDTATEKTKNFAKYLLEIGDKNNTFIRVEMA
jgi:Na+-transporting NADH:ubiquinone oxidoreductase subunit NqrF